MHNSDLALNNPYPALTGTAIEQVLLGEVWPWPYNPTCDIWATWDRRNRTIPTMGNATWDGETFCIADPRRTFARESTYNVSILYAYVGGIQHSAWVDMSALNRVVIALLSVAERLNVMLPKDQDLQNIAQDVHTQLHNLNTFDDNGVDLVVLPLRVLHYARAKRVVPHCRPPENLMSIAHAYGIPAQDYVLSTSNLRQAIRST